MPLVKRAAGGNRARSAEGQPRAQGQSDRSALKGYEAEEATTGGAPAKMLDVRRQAAGASAKYGDSSIVFGVPDSP